MSHVSPQADKKKKKTGPTKCVFECYFSIGLLRGWESYGRFYIGAGRGYAVKGHRQYSVMDQQF